MEKNIYKSIFNDDHVIKMSIFLYLNDILRRY